MDVETSEVIDRINARIDAMDVSLRAEIRGASSALRDDLRAEIRGESSALRDDLSALRDDLRAEIRGESSALRDDLLAEIRGESSPVRAELHVESTSVRAELRAEFREGFAESRRHTEVLFESLRDDIRMLADGFATVSTKLDSLQP